MLNLFQFCRILLLKVALFRYYSLLFLKIFLVDNFITIKTKETVMCNKFALLSLAYLACRLLCEIFQILAAMMIIGCAICLSRDFGIFNFTVWHNFVSIIVVILVVVIVIIVVFIVVIIVIVTAFIIIAWKWIWKWRNNRMAISLLVLPWILISRSM